jgi:L-lactate dehydrogenase complex protein LldG
VSARDDILARVRAANSDVSAAPAIVRDYLGSDNKNGATHATLVDLFEKRVRDYNATVHRCTADRAASTIGAVLAARHANRVIVPPGFPHELMTAIPEHLGDEPPLDVTVIDTVDGVVTTCALGIAETGTIVLDAGDGQGRRTLSLVPDYHLAVIRVDQIVSGLPDAIALLNPILPLTWISGPSATSDIELDRVEGVHGPRVLDVLVIEA